MSQKTVQFAADGDLERAYEDTARDKPADSTDSATKATRFKEKHSLDSDEEDNVEKYDILDEDDIEGQEDTKVDIEDGITFTPFNMREELEEGHFDSAGTYIFKRDKDQIKDSWMDNIDWVQVKERPSTDPQGDDDDGEDEPQTTDEIGTFQQMLELMKPGETVLKSLKRLGGGKAGAASSSASQRWKTKKKQKTEHVPETVDLKVDKENLLKLTGYADTLLACGNMEIYQDTYEKLAFKIKLAEDKKTAAKPAIPDDADDDDALDMFADDFDKKNTNNERDVTTGDDKSQQTQPTTAQSTEPEQSDEIRWQYKWVDKDDDEEIHGPFTSSEMLKWSEEGFFDDGINVRKFGAEGQFYSSARIDFELYT